MTQTAAVEDMPRQWLQDPRAWAAITAAAGLLAYALVKPSTCSDVGACVAQHSSLPANLNAYAACGLIMVLMNEVAGLISTYRGACDVRALIPDIRSRCMPSLLLTAMFAVLIVQNSIIAASSSPWYVNARPEDQAPVYTLTYLEWVTVVPLLLVISGHCALGIPLQEVARPLIVTNIYIVFSWMAMLTTSAFLKWALVTFTFGMYFHASCDMVSWVVKYRGTAPADLPSRSLRPCLSLGLIALFAIYAVVYMSSLLRIMSAKNEALLFLFLNVGTKLAMSIAFVVIRGNEYHKTLTGVLKKMGTSNVAMVSILRGSFDALFPCTEGNDGVCRLPAAAAGDMGLLESVLGKPVAGVRLGDLLVDDSERARFAAYVRNSVRQADDPQALRDMTVSSKGDCACGLEGQLPPVAQVLNCRMATATGSLDCAIHLSVVPRAALSLELERRMVAAVRFTGDNTPGLEQAISKEGFEVFDANGAEEEQDMVGELREHGEPVVASLLDVARMGLSAILVSTRSASGDSAEDSDGASSYVELKPKEGRPSLSRKDTSDTLSSYGEPQPNAGRPGLSRKETSDTITSSATKPGKPCLSRKDTVDTMCDRSVTEDSASMYSAPVPCDTLDQTAAASIVKPSGFNRARSCQSSCEGSESSEGSQHASGEDQSNYRSTVLEPEEEHWSRDTTKELDDVDELKPAQGMARQLDQRERDSFMASAKDAVEEMMGSLVSVDTNKSDKKAGITVTMRISPIQLGLAAGTVALAASAVLFAPRSRRF